MKKWILTICLLLVAGGCIPLASDIQNVGQQTLLVSEQIDALQEVLSTMGGEATGRNDKINEEIDRIQVTLVDVATSVSEADYVDGDDLGNAIKAIQVANAASAPVNPYAPLIQAALGLVVLVGGGYGVKKTVDANKSNTALKETVVAIDKAKAEDSINTTALKSYLGASQSAQTKMLVAMKRAGI